MIQLHIERRPIQLSPLEQSLAKAAASRHALRLQLQHQIAHKLGAYHPACLLSIHPDTLKYMVTKYSEQLVFCPLVEIQQWFNYQSGIFLEPGYPPLFYSRTEHRCVSPNKSAVAAIGEGVAGLLAQRLYHCRKLARPNHDYPDIVLQGNGQTYLVEAKATIASPNEIQAVLDEELLRMAAYVAACSELDARSVVGVLIGTALLNEQEYRSYVNEVSLCG
ncbi:MAG TPA: hypothetical protein V6D10_10440 [Trichocoleus sp.]|jgi:hypothetical protein